MSDESFQEQFDRVFLMSQDDQRTWDFTDNDQAALEAVLKSYAELKAALRLAEQARDAALEQTAFDESNRNTILVRAYQNGQRDLLLKVRQMIDALYTSNGEVYDFMGPMDLRRLLVGLDALAISEPKA